jgi:hypothetical protein
MSVGMLMSIYAQIPATPAAATPSKALTVEDVVKLSKAGLSDDTIIQKIRKNGQAFDLSPDQMIQLKSAGVGDKVVQAMLDPAKSEAVPAVTGAAAKAAGDFPDEVGVYMKRQGTPDWVEVAPEVVNWKTGGVLKSMASYGVVKGDVNGHLQGKDSKTVATTTTEFMVVAPEGVAVTEYQMLKLHENSDNREFRSMTGGVFHSSGGATKDQVQFQGKKVAPRHFLIELSANLTPGEYGFLPPGAYASTNAAGSTGKIYTFKVLE